MACTNSVDIYILWWIVKNKRSSSGLVDRAARMPEVLYLPWCLASYPPLHWSPPLVPSYSGIPLTCVLSSVYLDTAQAHSPSVCSGKGLGGKGASCLSQLYWVFLNGLTSARAALKYWTGREVKFRRTSRLEMIALYMHFWFGSNDHVLAVFPPFFFLFGFVCFFSEGNSHFLFIAKLIWYSSVPPQQGNAYEIL